MHYDFLRRVEDADHDVERKPCKQQPTRPIVAEEQENATDYSHETNRGDEKVIALKRAFSEMIDEADRSRENK